MNITEKADQESYMLQKAIAEQKIELDKMIIERDCRAKWASSKSIRETYSSLEGFIADELHSHQERLDDQARAARQARMREYAAMH